MKLKREEEDFFKREQALIHGYTAEIEHLKLDGAKYRSSRLAEAHGSKPTPVKPTRSAAKRQKQRDAANTSLMSASMIMETDDALSDSWKEGF